MGRKNHIWGLDKKTKRNVKCMRKEKEGFERLENMRKKWKED